MAGFGCGRRPAALQCGAGLALPAPVLSNRDGMR